MSHQKNRQQQRKRDLAIIHIAAQQLGYDRETYETMLQTITGKPVTSASQLDAASRRQVIKHLECCGFKRVRKAHAGHPGTAGPDRNKLISKVEAQLADMKLPWTYADAIARQMYSIERVRFCNAEQLSAIVAALYNRQKKQAPKP